MLGFGVFLRLASRLSGLISGLISGRVTSWLSSLGAVMGAHTTPCCADEDGGGSGGASPRLREGRDADCAIMSSRASPAPRVRCTGCAVLARLGERWLILGDVMRLSRRLTSSTKGVATRPGE